MNTNPMGVRGPWKAGLVLDWHSVSSECIGTNEFGHKIWETIRTDIGELMYRFKYKHDRSALDPIVKASIDLLKICNTKFDIIVPIPPSTSSRRITRDIADGIATKMGIAITTNGLLKIKATPNIKNLEDRKKETALSGALQADPNQLSGKSILLVDDLFDSGSTMTAATNTIYKQGKAKDVYAFAITRTR